MIDRFVETGVGVQIGPEPNPRRLQEVNQFIFGEILGAVELHVLHEVRQPLLVVVFQHRPRPNDQP